MEDGVRFIFKTLIKIPIIILVTYAIMNVFFFCYIYFKTLGLSYVVMQTAVENNYIPPQELKTLTQEVDSWLDIPMVTDAGVIINYDSSNHYDIVYANWTGSHNIKPNVGFIQNSEGEGGALGTKTYNPIGYSNSAAWSAINKKRQYGAESKVGIHCGYAIVWPLAYHQVLNNGTVMGFKNNDPTMSVAGNADGGFKSYSKLDKERGFTGTNQYGSYDAANSMFNNKNAGRNLAKKNNSAGKWTIMALDLCYNVPGLKYYPDLV